MVASPLEISPVPLPLLPFPHHQGKDITIDSEAISCVMKAIESFPTHAGIVGYGCVALRNISSIFLPFSSSDPQATAKEEKGVLNSTVPRCSLPLSKPSLLTRTSSSKLVRLFKSSLVSLYSFSFLPHRQSTRARAVRG